MNRIQWTTRQANALVGAYVSIAKDVCPDFKMKHEADGVNLDFIRTNLQHAQRLAFEADYWRKTVQKEKLLQIQSDVNAALWRDQLLKEKREAALAAVPLESLLDEIARRQQDALLERLLDRLEPMVMSRMTEHLNALANKQFGVIETRLRHNPEAISKDRPDLPKYVLVGLLHQQVNELRARFEGRVELLAVDKDDATALSATNSVIVNRICLVSRFIRHSDSRLVEKRASKMTMIHGGVSEFEHVINGYLFEYERVKG